MEADMPPLAFSTTTEAPSKASKSSEERRRRRFIWKVVSFGSCSKSCGGGTVSPIIRCIREGTPNKFFNHKRCADQDKPVLNESILRCNTQPCPAYWKIEEWSACNCGLPNEHEHQTREIKCVQELASGVVIQVVEAACLDKPPSKRQACACPKSPSSLIHHQHHTKRNHHSHPHSKGSFRAPVTLIGNSTIGKRVHVTENRNAGVWLSAEWGAECPAKCGDGVQHRSIFCDRSPPNVERCDLRHTPDTSRKCSTSVECDAGEWFHGPWTKCSGDCFSLKRSRTVYCMKEKQIVADTECIVSNDVEASLKPTTMEACELDDVAYCKPRWHYSEWTEVSFSPYLHAFYHPRHSFVSLFDVNSVHKSLRIGHTATHYQMLGARYKGKTAERNRQLPLFGANASISKLQYARMRKCKWQAGHRRSGTACHPAAACRAQSGANSKWQFARWEWQLRDNNASTKSLHFQCALINFPIVILLWKRNSARTITTPRIVVPHVKRRWKWNCSGSHRFRGHL